MQCEGRPASRFARDLDACFNRFGQAAGHRQPEARALALGTDVRGDLVEVVEDALQVLGGDTAPRVWRTFSISAASLVFASPSLACVALTRSALTPLAIITTLPR